MRWQQPHVVVWTPQVQAAALDEMFHHGEASALRYHKALLLMEGLSQLLTEQSDIVSVSRCELGNKHAAKVLSSFYLKSN